MSAQHNENATTAKDTDLKPFALSRDPTIALQETMKTIDQLRNVYARETDALSDADTRMFLQIQDEKLEAARNYQMSIEEVLRRKNEMKDVNPALREKLAAMQKEFSELAKQNLEALKRMQSSIERLGGTIRSAAKEAAKKQRTYSYSESGKIHSDTNKTVSMGVIETA